MQKPSEKIVISATPEVLLRAVASELGLVLSERQLEQLATHFSLLQRWNQKINLTAVRRPQEIATRHFEESLFLLKLVPCATGLLIDVGSGAGFPGLAVKIACPSLSAILLEPHHKKATFLKEVIRSCNLEGIEVRTDRLEQAARSNLAGCATIVSLRAVRSPRKILDALAQLLAPQGQLALFLGSDDATATASLPGFHWSSPAPIPHSHRRVILLGRHAASA